MPQHLGLQKNQPVPHLVNQLPPETTVKRAKHWDQFLRQFQESCGFLYGVFKNQLRQSQLRRSRAEASRISSWTKWRGQRINRQQKDEKWIWKPRSWSTDAAYLQELQRLENEAAEKNKKKSEKTKKKKSSKAKSQIDFGNVGDDLVGESVSRDDSEKEKSNESAPEEREMAAIDDEGALKGLWKKLSPPVSEESVVQQWYGIIYNGKKKGHLYVGKATRRFLHDVDGPVSGIEFDCLKPHIGTGTVLSSIPDHLERDISIFSIHDIIDGPLEVIPLKSGKWNVPAYSKLKEKFERVVKLNREALASTLK